jgi:hypothetical protein
VYPIFLYPISLYLSYSIFLCPIFLDSTLGLARSGVAGEAGITYSSHRCVGAARRIDGIWVFSVARAAGIESSRRRLRLLTPS